MYRDYSTFDTPMNVACAVSSMKSLLPSVRRRFVHELGADVHCAENASVSELYAEEPESGPRVFRQPRSERLQ
jgi:hypothetical protein